MNVCIEVVAMEAEASIISPKVRTAKVHSKVVVLVSTVTTSLLRALTSQGNTSRSAVSPVHTLIEGGLAVA